MVEGLLGKYEHVVMVRDGIIGAPALARADIGTVMRAIGSDAATETSDVALMQDDLVTLPGFSSSFLDRFHPFYFRNFLSKNSFNPSL